MTTSYPVNIGEYVVLHLTKEAKKELLEAIENGDSFDFGELGDDDVNVVAEFSGIGQGEVV